MKTCAIIGLGKRSREYHIPAIIKSEYVRLVAVCDINPDIVYDYSNKLDVKGYTNYDTLLKAEKPDFIIISTPHNTHVDIVKSAADYGIHVLKEKPLARTLEEGLELKNICENNNIKMMVCVQRRFEPMYALYFKLRERIGRIFFVEGRYSISVPHLDDGWRASKLISGGGCILDMGYHMIDLLLWYFGLPDKINAIYSCSRPEKNYDAEDTASIQFSYTNGIHGVFIISRTISPKTELFKIYGSEGTIEITKNTIIVTDTKGVALEKYDKYISDEEISSKQIQTFCDLIDNDNILIGDVDQHLTNLEFIDKCYK